jgi:hypothetical protein
LKEIGIPIDTKEEREEILKMREVALERAYEAGFSEEELAEGNETLSFWHLVHLIRIIVRDTESKTVTREEEAMDAARFTRAEVNEFREVFAAWVARSMNTPQAKDSVKEPLSMTLPAKKPSLPSIDKIPQSLQITTSALPTPTTQGTPITVRSASPMSNGIENTLEALLGTGEDGLLQFESMKMLLRSIGVDISVSDTKEMKEKLRQIGHRNDASVDFSDFLLAMRWILDMNIGDIRSKFAFGGKLREGFTSAEPAGQQKEAPRSETPQAVKIRRSSMPDALKMVH